MLRRRFARRSLQTKSIKCYKEHNPDRKSNLQLFIIRAIPSFIIIIITILTYLYRMTISVIETAINMGPVFTTGQPQHQELHALLFLNNVLGSLMSHIV